MLSAVHTRPYYVYTPPGYNSRQSKRYPVLYLLHGANDTAAGWTDVGKVNFILDNLIAEKKALPMIIVMPGGHTVPFDGPQTNNTPTLERYLLEEVIPQVERKYRLAVGRENRALVGLSMGGGQALRIGLDHLDMFGAIGAFSASAPLDFEQRLIPKLEKSEASRARLKLFWIGCGLQDPRYDRSEQLTQLLTAHHIPHTFRNFDGLHNFAFWRRCLVEVAPLLFRTRGRE